MGDKSRGLYQKFYVERTDGSSAMDEKHHGCDYFVMDMTHDKFAIAAVMAYADACEKEYPLLSADLRAKYRARSVVKMPRKSQSLRAKLRRECAAQTVDAL